MFSWVLILALGIIIGLALGVYFMRLDDEAKRTQQSLQQQLQQSKTDLQMYKAEVQSSYVTTAHLINNLTDSYKAVHQHLSQSAAHLCGDVATVNKLDLKDVNDKLLSNDESSSVQLQNRHTANNRAVAEETAQHQSASIATDNSDEAGAQDRIESAHSEDTKPTESHDQSVASDAGQVSEDEAKAYSQLEQSNASLSASETQASPSEVDDVSQSTSAEVERTSEENDKPSAQHSALNRSEVASSSRSKPAAKPTETPLSPEEEEALQEKLKLEQARVEASRMIH